jgi:hypothetical protein
MSPESERVAHSRIRQTQQPHLSLSHLFREEAMNEKSPNYNLLEEEWIPVLRTNGKFERVGIIKALTEAGTIRQIAASNPMDNVALLGWRESSES